MADDQRGGLLYRLRYDVLRTVASLTPTLYALIYFSLIPVFGLIYWALPSDFYHDSASSEASLRVVRSRIEAGLREEMVKQFKQKHGRTHVERDGWTLDINRLELHSLRANGSTIEFVADIPLEQRDGSAEMQLAPLVTMPLHQWYTENRARGSRCLVLNIDRRMPQAAASALPLQPEVLFPCRSKIAPQAPALLIPGPLLQDINAFAVAATGLASPESGTIGAMFYLSAVTVTTLGYGDIVPVTGWARFATSTEAVLGLITISLFLNSLVYKYRRG